VKITFKLDFSLFGLATFELSDYFQPTQNSEEPGSISYKSGFFFPTFASILFSQAFLRKTTEKSRFSGLYPLFNMF